MATTLSAAVSILVATLPGSTAFGPNKSTYGAGQRTTISFNYAWRFHYGDDPSSPPGSGPGTAVFETDLANYSRCDGVEHAPNRFSMKDCRLACAYDPNCLVWQAFPIEHGEPWHCNDACHTCPVVRLCTQWMVLRASIVASSARSPASALRPRQAVAATRATPG